MIMRRDPTLFEEKIQQNKNFLQNGVNVTDDYKITIQYKNERSKNAKFCRSLTCFITKKKTKKLLKQN